jgi:hypothetical protein
MHIFCCKIQGGNMVDKIKEGRVVQESAPRKKECEVNMPESDILLCLKQNLILC